MHLDYLWLATDLRVDRHGKDKAVICLIREIKLLEPQSLHFMGTDEAVLRFGSVSSPVIAIRGQRWKEGSLTYRASSSGHRLQRRPFPVVVRLDILHLI